MAFTYTDEVRALYDQAEADLKASSTEQGNVARGQATSRAAGMGRYNQPVQEWTYSQLEKNLAAALNTGLANLAVNEAGSISQARQFDEQARLTEEARKSEEKSRSLEAIFGLIGTVAPYMSGVFNPNTARALKGGPSSTNLSSYNNTSNITDMDTLRRMLSGNKVSPYSNNKLMDIYQP